MTILFRILSPFGLLLMPAVSYFFYCFDLDFQNPQVAAHVLWLGILTTVLAFAIFQARPLPVQLERRDADSVIGAVLPIYALLAGVVFVGTGGSLSALLDDRFSVPGLGVIYPFFTIGALLVFSSWTRCTGIFAKMLFLLLFAYIGVVVGGKSFFIPAIMGLSFAALSQIYRPPLLVLVVALLLAAASIVFVLSKVSDNLELTWWIFSNRVIKSADSVEVFSKLSDHDIQYFPISVGTFLLDFVLRFFGQRVNTLSVGSTMAFDVTGDATGAGPNPTLPILGYLLSRGDIWSAVAFLVVTLAVLAFVVNWFRRRQREGGPSSIYFAAAVFSAPVFIVDLVMYLQEIFALIVFALIAAALNRLKSSTRKSGSQDDSLHHYGNA